MNWLQRLRYAPKKTLLKSGFLVASILLLGSGRHVPALDRHALASVTPPIQQVNETLAKPASFGKQVSLETPTSLIGRMWDDQKNFYSPESLTLLGGGLIVGGAMANSSIDDGIHRHFQSSVRGATSDD
jgi:hypothetical protein